MQKKPLHVWYGENFASDPGISPFHTHTAHELLLVLEGEVSMHIAGKSYRLHAGQMAVINAVEAHDLFPETYPYRRIGVHITTEELHRILGNFSLASVILRHGEDFCHVLSPAGETEVITELLWGMVREYTAPAPMGERILAHRFEELLIRLSRACPQAFAEYGRDGQMEEVCRLIDREFSREITVEELAKMHFFSTRYFIRRFHRAVGYTPHRYLLLRRLAESRVLLSTTALSVTHVAASCGFGDAGGFVRAFRKETGVTPGEYRRRYARDLRAEEELSPSADGE